MTDEERIGNNLNNEEERARRSLTLAKQRLNELSFIRKIPNINIVGAQVYEQYLINQS